MFKLFYGIVFDYKTKNNNKMKKTILILFISILSLGQLSAQDTGAKLPNVTIKTLDGKSINANSFNNDGKPFAICFWATWCKPCLMELNNMAEVYEDWQDEHGFKVYAVSIDDSRTSSKVMPIVNSSAWEYDIILDQNSELKRALGVNNPPHTFVVNGSGEIVWQHVGYSVGDEAKLLEVLKKVANNLPLD